MNEHVESEPQVAFIPGVGHLDYYCGASESVFQIAKHMRRKPLVITDGPFGLTERLRESSIPWVTLPSPVSQLHGIRTATVLQKARFGVEWLKYGYKLRKLLCSRNISTVYTANAVAMLAAKPVRLAGAKLVTGIRGGPDRMHKWWSTLSRSDRVAVLSREMRDSVLRSFDQNRQEVLRPKMEVIYNGVDLALADAASHQDVRDSLGLSPDSLVLLYVAGFREWKGQLPVIEEGLPRVLSQCGSDVHVVFLGSATEPKDLEYEAKCRAAAAGSNWSKQLHFVGYQRDVWSWYRASDLVILASQFEGMPRCLIEAMACGVPAVSYDVCSAHELLTSNDAGIVVEQGDLSGFVDAIVRLIRSPSQRATLGQKGRHIAETELDVRAIAEKYETMFQSLAG